MNRIGTILAYATLFLLCNCAYEIREYQFGLSTPWQNSPQLQEGRILNIDTIDTLVKIKMLKRKKRVYK